ncbi:MAG: zf-TFIIB domain-containing protein [Kofleriaceae bacterium]
MNCPRCNATLAELDRDGITIDRCDRCRGIWLDRGELEKLLALRSPAETTARPRRDRDDDDDDDDDRRSRGRDGRRSWWEIFD